MASALYIDADACPVMREALACARRARTPVVIVGNTTQNLARHIRSTDPRDAEHARGRLRMRIGHGSHTTSASCCADSTHNGLVGDVFVSTHLDWLRHRAAVPPACGW